MFGKLRSGSMAKRQESIVDRLFRFRGLTIIVSAPLVLLLLYILLFPRCAPRSVRVTMRTVASTMDAARVCRASDLNGTDASATQYAVVFDAGSTGSRVHVFEFATTREGLVLRSDTFEQLKPGLGDAGWSSEPERAAASLQPLLEKAIDAVPASHHATTPIEVRATAGLRLLPGSTADHILEEVEKLLAASPFMVIQDAVSIMDGVDEGAYAWLTLNYLLGNTGKPMEKLVGAIDLGGGSVQQAFAVPDKVATKAPTGSPPAPSEAFRLSLSTSPSAIATALASLHARHACLPCSWLGHSPAPPPVTSGRRPTVRRSHACVAPAPSGRHP